MSVPFTLVGVTQCRACQTKVETRVTYANFLVPAWLLVSIFLRRMGIELTADTPIGMLMLVFIGFLQIRLVTFKVCKP